MAGDVETTVWSSEEVRAVGERILGSLGEVSTRTLEELIAILGEKRGLVRIAGSVLERAGSITIARRGDVVNYSLTE